MPEMVRVGNEINPEMLMPAAEPKAGIIPAPSTGRAMPG